MGAPYCVVLSRLWSLLCSLGGLANCIWEFNLIIWVRKIRWPAIGIRILLLRVRFLIRCTALRRKLGYLRAVAMGGLIR